jgi:hypothetical protein
MSRRKGARGRPQKDRRAYREQFTSPRQRPVEARDLGEPISRRRRWGAALAGTLVLVVAFAAVINAIVQLDAGDEGGSSTSIAVAAGLVPICFTVLVVVSKAPRPVLYVAMATPMAIAGFIGLGAILQDPATALLTSFGIAGALVMRAEPDVHRTSLRISFVGVAALVTLVLGFVAPAGAIVLAPLAAFPVSVVADIISEGRAADARAEA